MTEALPVGAQAWFVAGIFVLLALPVSIYEVAMHLEYFSRPTLQIRVIRILWMVPIYALDSWLALRFKARPPACPPLQLLPRGQPARVTLTVACSDSPHTVTGPSAELLKIQSRACSAPRARRSSGVATGVRPGAAARQGTALYLDVIRECYEAYVIYNFFMYLVAYLEDEFGDVDAYFSTKEDVAHLWGLGYLVRPWRMGEEFFWECKKARRPAPPRRQQARHTRPTGAALECLPARRARKATTSSARRATHAASVSAVAGHCTDGFRRARARAGAHRLMQTCPARHRWPGASLTPRCRRQGVLSYVILRPMMTATGFIAQLCGVYGDGALRFDRVYIYTVIVSNFSQARRMIPYSYPARRRAVRRQGAGAVVLCVDYVWGLARPLSVCGGLRLAAARPMPVCLAAGGPGAQMRLRRACVGACAPQVVRLASSRAYQRARPHAATPLDIPLLQAPGAEAWPARAVLGALLPRPVLQGDRGGAGANPAHRQVPVRQGGRVLDLLAGRGHRHPRLGQGHPDQGARACAGIGLG